MDGVGRFDGGKFFLLSFTKVPFSLLDHINYFPLFDNGIGCTWWIILTYAFVTPWYNFLFVTLRYLFSFVGHGIQCTEWVVLTEAILPLLHQWYNFSFVVP